MIDVTVVSAIVGPGGKVAVVFFFLLLRLLLLLLLLLLFVVVVFVVVAAFALAIASVASLASFVFVVGSVFA